jgi:stearoyl-CoA desaturase (delta-9 desaturase)
MSLGKDIYQWFDKRGYRMVECLWLAYAHTLGIMGFVWFFMLSTDMFWKFLIGFLIWHNLTGLGITGGAHRLWAHKAYTASMPLKIYLMLMNCNCFQGSIWHWSRDHRLHHKYSDTELDPHNSLRGIFFSHVGWLLEKKSPALVEEGKRIDMSDLKKEPVVMF